MDRPYYFADFMTAQLAGGLVLALWVTALHRSRVKIALLVVAITLTAFAPMMVPPREADVFAPHVLLELAAVLTALTTFGAVKRSLLVALSGVVAIDLAVSRVPTATLTIAGVELVWIAAVAAMECASSRALPNQSREPRSLAWLDLATFVLATVAAAIVATRVLERYMLAGDEWADTWQADVFAHFRAYGTPHACARAFQNWWVFDWQGRRFAQYTPGWPLFMAPFTAVGAVWLAAPVMFGIAAVGMVRLARRFAPNHALVVSLVVAGSAIASPALLLNAGSRYPHVMVCAAFAWMIESLCAVASPSRRPIMWGAILATSAVLLLATRPLDGVGLGLAPGVYFVWLVAKKRISSRTLASVVVTAATWTTLVLVILHAQLGRWFATGYSVTPHIREIGDVRFNMPTGVEAVNSLGFDKIVEWWWPCIPALAAIGLVMVGKRERAFAVVFALSAVGHIAAYTMSAFMRDGSDSGYSPRFRLPVIVFAVVFASVAIVNAWNARRPGGFAIVVAVLALGTLRIGPSFYPRFHTWLHEKHALARAIEASNIHHAVVVVHDGAIAMQPWDATQNFDSPSDGDVLIITDYRAGDDFECARRELSDRSWYEARGQSDVALVRIP